MSEHFRMSVVLPLVLSTGIVAAQSQQTAGLPLSNDSPSSSQTPSSSKPTPITNNIPSPTPSTPAQQQSDSNISNYYFIVIALFVIIVGVLLWIGHKSHKRKLVRSRDGQNAALTQDLAGWPTSRRWLNGTWRGELAAMRMRREEGLDDRGEAPPPYHRDSQALNASHSDMEMARPVQAHLREPEQVKPPDYEARVDEARPDITDIRHEEDNEERIPSDRSPPGRHTTANL